MTKFEIKFNKIQKLLSTATVARLLLLLLLLLLLSGLMSELRAMSYMMII
jgi:hypothetical protein